MENILEIKNLSKAYKERKILNEISLIIKKGEFVVIKGESGSGKTTLLNTIAGFTNFDDGKILLEGNDISKYSKSQLAEYRLYNLGFVFQQYRLLSELTVKENIILPLLLQKRNKSYCEKKCSEILHYMKLENKSNNIPDELSGGECQRVAIARGIITNPKILLADEPTGNLDSVNSDLIVKLLGKLNRELGITIMMVTHSDQIRSEYTRKIIVQDGVIV